MVTLKQIQDYLKRASIIPIGKDKTPLIPWKEFQTRKATIEEATSWLEKFPEMNIGIVTGKLSNIAVVDVEAGGSVEGLPDTVIAKTGNGGWHYYYQFVEGIDNKARIRPLTDIRGEGGYVVAPPSETKYEKDGKVLGGKYEWIKQTAIQPFPKHLFGVREKTNWDDISQGVPDGQRNATAAQYIGKLMNVFSIDTWENTVWETAIEWNKKNNPPMSERQLRVVYESIKRRARENPKKQNVAKEVKGIEFVSFSKVLLDGIEDLLTTNEKDVISFGYSWLDDKMTGIFKSELVVIGGESGSGKTTFAMNVVYKASLKHKCAVFALEDRLNDYAIIKLYFEIGKIRREEGKKNYPWNEYRKGVFKEDPQFLKYLDMAFTNQKNENIFMAKVDEQMNIETLEKAIEEKVADGFELFLVDHLHYFDLSKGESSKADYIEKVMVRLKTTLNKTGAKMLMVVHYKKLEGKKPTLDSFKDSISIVQNANYVINLWRERYNIQDAMRYLTTFLIPKARNPNGEGMIEATFNPETNDYADVGSWQAGTTTNLFKEITSLN